MTREETLAIMSVLKAAYPNFYKDMGRKEADGIVALWTDMFRDEPAQVVAMAVKAHIATDRKGYPPHIGAIKDAICKIKAPEEMTEIEAWNLVRSSLRSYAYDAQAQFEKLPPVVQRLVGSSSVLQEWAGLDDNAITVVASNFQRSYKARAAHEREFLALPSEIKEAMTAIAAGMAMPMLPKGE